MDLKLTLEPCPLVQNLVPESIEFAGALRICCALQPQIFEVQLENCRFIAHQEIIEIISLSWFILIVFGVVESSFQFLLVFLIPFALVFDGRKQLNFFFCRRATGKPLAKGVLRASPSHGIAKAASEQGVFVYLSLSMPKQQELAGEKRVTDS